MASSDKSPKTSGRPRGPRPDLQKYPGELGTMRLAWSRMKAQAKFRNIIFELSWEEFIELWQGKWHLRGSEVGCLSMSRRDFNLPWTRDNIEIVARKEIMRKQGLARIGTKYRRR